MNFKIVGINHLKLKIASRSITPFLEIKIAVPSHISINSSLVFTSGFVPLGNRIINCSSLDFATIKNVLSLLFAIIGDFTSFNLFNFNLHSFARIFKAFADWMISISPICFPSSKTDKFSACFFVIGIP